LSRVSAAAPRSNESARKIAHGAALASDFLPQWMLQMPFFPAFAHVERRILTSGARFLAHFLGSTLGVKVELRSWRTTNAHQRNRIKIA
jgi:hypothetical protein